MNYVDILYNVNEIIVDLGLEKSYREFSCNLDTYLLNKYGEYYLGLQLYEINERQNHFYVVASYDNDYGLGLIIGDIQKYIYDYKWKNSVKRISVFSFTTSTRAVPPLY
ncbi:hypothetical protein [Terrisporobacter mayombei]|uniref:Uncharacterized protein n=1 Tax=Terrisporobacter mayombei TaxID=1541 RepID=A0ABY9Q414_9FIRM|nr:hypothetical protein [Terrisporobacter mayombei]MCC3867513.1 hypothetical protein [Terrisporobacter mayombei]WMT81775.1 hypothetical protein TEMA_21230 [Terrisporobacter mayombei]